jgi:hypothetical protein
MLNSSFCTRILAALCVAALAYFAVGPLGAQSGGCYICQGQPDTYVKFEGKDNWDKRIKAEACGCKVGGTTSRCDAANYKILCEVK